MSEYSELLDGLEKLEALEVSEKVARSRLDRKELVNSVLSFQTGIIKLQRLAIDSLQRILEERSKITQQWEELLEGFRVSKEELQRFEEGLLKGVRDKQVQELEKVLVAKDKRIESLERDLDKFRKR